MNNPKTAIDAILQCNESGPCSEHGSDQKGFRLYPLTIARYAILELLESPFVTFNHQGKMTLDEVIPTVYVMSVPARELSKYSSKNIGELRSDAFEWSEELTPENLAIALSTLSDNVLALSRIAPETVEDSKKKASG